jgi:cell division protein FtsL
VAILDWVKEVPLSAVYKERLVDSEKQVSVLEQKSLDLEAKVLVLEQEKVELASRLQQSEHTRRALDKKIAEIL